MFNYIKPKKEDLGMEIQYLKKGCFIIHSKSKHIQEKQPSFREKRYQQIFIHLLKIFTDYICT